MSEDHQIFVIKTHLFSKTSLSFKPNLHSGVPLRYALIMICPSTSARNTEPAREQSQYRSGIYRTCLSTYLLCSLTGLPFQSHRQRLRFCGTSRPLYAKRLRQSLEL